MLNKQMLSLNGARRVRAVVSWNLALSSASRWGTKPSSSSSSSKATGGDSSDMDEKCDKKTNDATWSDAGEQAFNKQSDITKRLRLMLKSELRDGMEIAKQLPTIQTRTFENVNSLTYVEYKPQRRAETVRAQSTQNWSNTENNRRLSRNSGMRMDSGGGQAVKNNNFYKLTSKSVNGADQTPLDKILAKSVK